jgi:hypothetical protein
MAFFGLTALGIDRPLDVGRDRIQHLHVFEDKDWTTAWEMRRRGLKCSKQDAEDVGLPLETLPAIMEAVYHGPVPAPDAALLEAWIRRVVVGEEEATGLRKASLLEAVRAARREAETLLLQHQQLPPAAAATSGDGCSGSSGTTTNTNTTTTNTNTTNYKAKAKTLGPREKYMVPLTAQQEIGWEAASHVPDPKLTNAGRKSSEETKFVSKLLGQGLYYF